MGSLPDRSRETGNQPQTTSKIAVLVIVEIWIIVGLVASSVVPWGRSMWSRWWWAIAAAYVGQAGVAWLLSRWGRIKDLPKDRKATAVFLVFIPLIATVVAVVALLPNQFQITALRSSFLLIVCLFPAAMWWLFLQTRRQGLLNRFIANLNRLGLLRAQEEFDEAEASRRRRVDGYVQSFEAAFGSLTPRSRAAILANTYDDQNEEGSRGQPHAVSPTTVPILVATVMVALGWILILPPLPGSTPAGTDMTLAERWLSAFRPAEDPVGFAFLGAYFFGVQMLFRRYVLSDLQPAAYVAVTMRIILAVTGTWVLVVVLRGQMSAEALSIVGFAVGVFPRIGWQVIQSSAKRLTGTVVRMPSLRSKLPLSDLDGLTVWHEARLEEEDIENTPSLATADVVQLLVSTRFSPDRIIDWVDQAILLTALGPKTKTKDAPTAAETLRSHGIRTASDLRAIKKLPGFDQLLGCPDGVSVSETLYLTLATNPNLVLVERWRCCAERKRKAAAPIAVAPPWAA